MENRCCKKTSGIDPSSFTSRLQVEIETNGAVDLAAFCEERPVFTMDYKLPSSGCEEHMITENMELLEKNDTVKFVCGSQEDLLKALELIRTYDLTNRCHVYLSPVFGSIEPSANSRIYVETSVEWCTVADTDA